MTKFDIPHPSGHGADIDQVGNQSRITFWHKENGSNAYVVRENIWSPDRAKEKVAQWLDAYADANGDTNVECDYADLMVVSMETSSLLAIAQGRIAELERENAELEAKLGRLADRWDAIGNADIEVRQRKWEAFEESKSPYLNGISHELDVITERANTIRNCASELRRALLNTPLNKRG